MESSKKEIVIKKADDHWAFLEHIEAPMWVDLTLEAKSCGEDINDAWFNTSHLFHQWSSKQLKCKFSHPGDEVMTSEVDFQGPPSPELPSSVSRSRGKHYKSKKWRGDSLDVLLDKQQAARGLSRKFFQADSCGGREVKPKSNVIKSKGVSSAKPRLRFERKASGNASSNRTNPVSTRRNATISLSSGDNSTSKSDTRSTITSANAYQQPKYMEVSGQPCHLKSESLSSRGINLRKSCVTTKIGSRIEIDENSRQSRGRKSSSGKSSVGSSSNPSSVVKLASKQMEFSSQPCHLKRESLSYRGINLRKSCIPTKIGSRIETDSNSRQSRGRKSSSGKSSVGSSSDPGSEVELASKQRIDITAKNRCKPPNVFRGSTVLVEGAKSDRRREINLAKPVYHRAAKPMGKENDQREAKNQTNLGRRIYLR
ncbi:hypothetical protein L6164_022531 [Bauhinia variegata]|uniref:Uncharacterized protein n=1 Tax=Bauhinia variegata TaxID=167791 RepID=A0ACB9MHA3_BAUVA|nr:hypothetical protein L6164_022531 [Bauhinia variegata]